MKKVLPWHLSKAHLAAPPGSSGQRPDQRVMCSRPVHAPAVPAPCLLTPRRPFGNTSWVLRGAFHFPAGLPLQWRVVDALPGLKKTTKSQFWGSHQRFYKQVTSLGGGWWWQCVCV